MASGSPRRRAGASGAGLRGFAAALVVALILVACLDIKIGDTNVQAQVPTDQGDPEPLPFLFLEQCVLRLAGHHGINKPEERLVDYCITLDILLAEAEGL